MSMLAPSSEMNRVHEAKPDGYLSDVEDGGFDFGDSSSTPGPRKPDASAAAGEVPLVWPAKQLKAGRRGGFGKPSGRRSHVHGGGGGGYRRGGEGRGDYPSSSSSGGSVEPPQQRWRSRGRRPVGRSGQWESTMDHRQDKVDGIIKKSSALRANGETAEAHSVKGTAGTNGIIQYGDLEFFLNELHLGQYIHPLREQGTTFVDLLDVTDEGLIKLGITEERARRAILEGVVAIHKKKWHMPSDPIPVHVTLNAKDVSVILSHLSTHISYLKGTASLLSRQIEANPSLIDSSQDSHETKGVLQNLSVASHSMRCLSEELHSVESRIHQIAKYHSSARKPSPTKGTVRWRGPLFLSVGSLAIAAGLTIVCWRKSDIAQSTIWQRLSTFGTSS